MGVKRVCRRAFRELVERAREGKSLPDDLTGGTFTITNLGMYRRGRVHADHQPARDAPSWAWGASAPSRRWWMARWWCARCMWLSLTFDHRLVDGAPGRALFAGASSRYIESALSAAGLSIAC